jgi:hypothetical protein
LLADVDLAQIDDTRTHWPFLRDRRIDAYGDLTQRFLDVRPSPHEPTRGESTAGPLSKRTAQRSVSSVTKRPGKTL